MFKTPAMRGARSAAIRLLRLSWCIGLVVAACVAFSISCSSRDDDQTADELIETRHRFVQLDPAHDGSVDEFTVTAAFTMTFRSDGFDAVLETYPLLESGGEQLATGSWRRDGDDVVATVEEVDGADVDDAVYTLTFDEGFIASIDGPNREELGYDWVFLLGAGDRHPAVVELHKRLAAIDYLDFEMPQGDRANLYDEQTRQAVVRFQEAEGLPALGFVGPETWRRLENPTGSATQPPPADVPAEAPPATGDVPAEAPPATGDVPAEAPPVTGDTVIYLTFDDGPSPYSEQVMQLLSQYDAHAAFFLLGQQVDAQPALVAQESQLGHATTNHTYSHASLAELDEATIIDEVRRTQEAIVAAGGVASRCIRPPYGETDDRTASLAAAGGFQVVLWTIDPQDWRQPGADQIASYVIDNAAPGAIILMHDGGGNRDQTVEALGTILQALDQQGYRFESIC